MSVAVEQSPPTTANTTTDPKALPRLQALRKAVLDAPYALCTQKAELLTRFFQERTPAPAPVRRLEQRHYKAYLRALEKQSRGEPQNPWLARLSTSIMRGYEVLQPNAEHPVVDFAHGVRYVLEHMQLKVYDHELIVGNPSSQRIGAPLHPDYGGLLMAPELDTLATRTINPVRTTAAQLRLCHKQLFPYWFRRSVLAHTPRYSRDPHLASDLTDGSLFLLTQIAGISHVTPDYPSVLRLGFRGLARRLRQRQRALKAAAALRTRPTPQQREQLAFCEAGLVAAKATCAYGARWQAHLLAEADRCTDGMREGELRDLAKLFARVPAQPARTFHEALQAVFITHTMLHQESFQHGISFGRMDQYLLPCYQSDLAAGRLDRSRAVELIGCFLVKAAELIPLFFDRATDYFSGLSSASGITLGGQLSNGTDATNELSYLFLEAYDQVRLRQPNLHARIHKNTPAAFLAACCASLKKSGGMPAFFNDNAIVAALTTTGINKHDALNYAVVGCAEWGIPYREFPAAGAAFVNLAQILQLALHNGRLAGRQQGPRTGTPEQVVAFGQLLQAFKEQLRAVLARVHAGNRAVEKAHAHMRPTPLLSVLVGGCIDNTADVTAGGARLNATGIQFVGLADVVDSLVAIRTLVYGHGDLSLDELVRATDANFQSNKALRARIANRVPKYGTDATAPADLAQQLTTLIDQEIDRLPPNRGGAIRWGLWTMTTHQGFGQRTGALPSGRLAGEPLANGMSPVQGCAMGGPTASLTDAARIPAPTNGAVLNQTLNPAHVRGKAGTATIAALVRGYVQLGGAQVQFNVVDPKTLRAAQQDPEAHRDLVVRISGYSAYFVDLTQAMQEELIARAEHRPRS